MSEDGEINFKTGILKSLEDIDEKDIVSILEYVRSEDFATDLKKIKELQRQEDTLSKIAESVKKMIPFGAEFDSEKIIMPTVGDHADCNDVDTCHVDEFLYDADAVDELVEKGKLSKFVCCTCDSRQIKELTLISHSLSKKILHFIFKVLLPSDLHRKTVLDIGSRLGAVLYAAYHFTNAENIIGIEMNQEMCELQKSIIEKFSMDKNRIKVIHANILDCSDFVNSADVVILNVLDFFVSLEEQQRIWRFFKDNFKKHTYFVTNRGVPETLVMCDLEDEFTGWLTVCKPFQLHNEVFFDLNEFDYSELYLYRVN